ncbi:AMP-binding protein [Sedimenticola sp.]|uniref:class I adenylate-forming enzyme family protein n=1 Tax=Sedimenticola sp. TaxID=1940285 RepID=UPI003D0A199A
MLITEILSRNGRMFADEIALVERDPAARQRREISWQAFDQEASRFANALIAQGVKRGDRVLHLMMNGIEWLPCYFGILRAGAIAAPLNFRFESELIQRCNEIAEAKVLLFGPEFVARIQAVKPALDRTIQRYVYIGPDADCPSYAVRYADFVSGANAEPPGIALQITDPAALYFTSGTTGLPKAVSLTQRNLEHACYVENQHHRQTHEDNFLCIPPLYHTGAKMHWFGNFVVGAKAVLLKGARPEWILEAVSEEQATIVWLLVPWAHDILIAWENGELDFGRYKLDQWRLMHIGAQPVPPNLIKAWKKLFPHHAYDTNYGLTESSGPGCIHLGLGNSHKIGAIGKPGFDWEACIVDDQGNRLPTGQSGELLVKGPGVMQGYYRNREATAETIRDGWLHTGDIARMDSEGFIWLVDRKKDLIITGGENVSPVEVEHYFLEHPHIQDIAVIGTPDPRLGELVTAIIQFKEGRSLTEQELTAFSERLPRYKRPRRFYFDNVPRNATGKIEKPLLRERYAGVAEV